MHTLLQHKQLKSALAILLGLTLLAPVSADEQQRLQQIRKDISDLRLDLGSDREKQTQLQKELQRLEKEIDQLSRKLHTTHNKIAKQQHTQQQLKQEAGELQKKLSRQRDHLSRQIRAGYSAGQQQALKILLSQTNPAEAGRTLTYYGYFTRAQLQAVEETQLNIRQLQTANKKLSDSTAKLKTLEAQQQEQHREREQSQSQRKTILAKLNSNIQSKEQSLKQLLADETALANVLQDIDSKTNTSLNFNHLGKLKGKLKWPTKGRIRHNFGESRKQGRMRWQGIMISGKEGQDIHAIAPGQVVFADWIRGYGLMLIVDHGNGYMSLYGHTQSLYKDVGDKINANEVIAALGSSGGSAENGLYFELRHKGKPINPRKWFR